MIKFQANNALVYSVSPEIEIPSKSGGQSFIKRELVINDSWERDGTVHPNFVLIEFSGDKMAQLDSITAGMRVNVEAMINGREHNGRIFISARGMTVTPTVLQQPYAPSPSYMGYPQQPQQQFGASAPGYPQQPAYQPQQYAPQQQFGNGQFNG